MLVYYNFQSDLKFCKYNSDCLVCFYRNFKVFHNTCNAVSFSDVNVQLSSRLPITRTKIRIPRRNRTLRFAIRRKWKCVECVRCIRHSCTWSRTLCYLSRARPLLEAWMATGPLRTKFEINTSLEMHARELRIVEMNVSIPSYSRPQPVT